MKKMYGTISEDLETAFEPFETKEQAIKRRDYYNGYKYNSRYIAIECEADEDGEADLSNFNIL